MRNMKYSDGEPIERGAVHDCTNSGARLSMRPRLRCTMRMSSTTHWHRGTCVAQTDMPCCAGPIRIPASLRWLGVSPFCGAARGAGLHRWRGRRMRRRRVSANDQPSYFERALHSPLCVAAQVVKETFAAGALLPATALLRRSVYRCGSRLGAAWSICR